MRVTCSLCSHQERAKIDKALINGASKLSIARQYGVHRTTVARHISHLSQKLAKRAQEREDGYLDGLLDEIKDDRRIMTEAIDALRGPDGRIKESNAHKIARMVRERRAGSEFIGRAVGILGQKPQDQDQTIHTAVIVVPPPAPLGEPIPQHLLQPPRIALGPGRDDERGQDEDIIDAEFEDQGDDGQGNDGGGQDE